MPFEGAGAISCWTLEMPTTCNSFDFETITDVILKLQYTAREGGSEFSQAARAAVSLPPPDNLTWLTSANHDFPNEWYRFQHPTDVNATMYTFALAIGPDRFPFLYRDRIAGVNKVALIVRPADPNSSADGAFDLTAPDGSAMSLTLEPSDASGGFALPSGTTGSLNAKPFGQWTFTTAVNPAAIADMFLVFWYSVT